MVRHGRYVTFQLAEVAVSARIRADPGEHRSAACAACAGMTRAVVNLDRKVTGEVCPDDGESANQRWQIALGVRVCGDRSALPTRIGFKIAWEALKEYAVGWKRRSSGEYRQLSPAGPTSSR